DFVYFFITPNDVSDLFLASFITSCIKRDAGSFLFTNLEHRLSASAALLRRVPPISVTGTVVALQGLLAEVGGLTGLLAIGDRLHLCARDGRVIAAEV